jgi:hypothetical protein
VQFQAGEPVILGFCALAFGARLRLPDAAGVALSAITGTLNAITGWVSPFRVTAPISSRVTVCSTATATRCPTRIWPSLASAHRRAARLHTVPIAV